MDTQAKVVHLDIAEFQGGQDILEKGKVVSLDIAVCFQLLGIVDCRECLILLA